MLRNPYAFLKTTECKARSYLGIAVYVLKQFCSLKLVSQSSEPSETHAWVLVSEEEWGIAVAQAAPCPGGREGSLHNLSGTGSPTACGGDQRGLTSCCDVLV